jgi:hypothetical protein
MEIHAHVELIVAYTNIVSILFFGHFNVYLY